MVGVFFKKEKKSCYFFTIFSYNPVSRFPSSVRWKSFDLGEEKNPLNTDRHSICAVILPRFNSYAWLSNHLIDWHAISTELGLQLSLNQWNFKGRSIDIFRSSLELVNT